MLALLQRDSGRACRRWLHPCPCETRVQHLCLGGWKTNHAEVGSVGSRGLHDVLPSIFNCKLILRIQKVSRWGIKPSAPPGEQVQPALHSIEEELKKWQDRISDDDRRQIRKAIEELMDKYLGIAKKKASVMAGLVL